MEAPGLEAEPHAHKPSREAFWKLPALPQRAGETKPPPGAGLPVPPRPERGRDWGWDGQGRAGRTDGRIYGQTD